MSPHITQPLPHPLAQGSTAHAAPQPVGYPALPGQHYLFSGSLVSGSDVAAHWFTVLAGDGGPTVTGGFAKWNVIDRPQRVGVTVLAGYDPISMTVPVLFDGVSTYAPKDGSQIERDIEVLEWMGGRGLLFAETPGVGHAGLGDSPLVRVWTVDGQGANVPLVPFSYQSDNLFWVVSQIAYDGGALRNRDAQRIRQSATITLTEHVAGPFSDAADSAAARQRARKGLGDGFITFRTTDAINTIKLVAVKVAHNASHEAALAILQANRDNRRVGTSIFKHLARGTLLKIPRRVVKQLV